MEIASIEEEEFDPQYDSQGLIPAVVQDAVTRQVLMVAWMNPEALRLTTETGEAYFWSRSRQSLWHKGATSGNIQKVREIRVDCDADTLLLLVDPAGPACHTGEVSCFFRSVAPKRGVAEQEPKKDYRLLDIHEREKVMSSQIEIEDLYQILLDRKEHPRAESYTSQLLNDEVEIAKKIGEEAIEVILAASNQSKERLTEESADLVYHLLVLLVANDLTWDDVTAELGRRRR